MEATGVIMARYTVPKRLRKIVEHAEKAGWTYDVTRKGHPRLNPPRGARNEQGDLLAPITFALTPSDIAGDRNSIAALRRAGVDIPRGDR